MIRMALYEPDIPQNTGTILRMGACLGVSIDLIEPFGFILDDNRLKRAGMDYISRVDKIRHKNWQNFTIFATEQQKRIVLLTTKVDTNYLDFSFKENDILLLGRESAGVPEAVHNYCKERVTIPLRAGERSLNIAIAGAMVLSEALRQIDYYNR